MFRNQYQCFGILMLPGKERDDVEQGGKIIMPTSALDRLIELETNFPFLFELTNRKINLTTHCGVLEFTADEEKVYLPYWMMEYLLLEDGDMINIESVSLPIASYICFRPQSEEFYDITDQNAVLIYSLRKFSCLTTGDIIAIQYNKKTYKLRILETQPAPAVCVLSCDPVLEIIY